MDVAVHLDETLRLAMKEASVQSPNKSYEVKRVLEDGDLVAVHARLFIASDAKEIGRSAHSPFRG